MVLISSLWISPSKQSASYSKNIETRRNAYDSIASSLSSVGDSLFNGKSRQWKCEIHLLQLIIQALLDLLDLLLQSLMFHWLMQSNRHCCWGWKITLLIKEETLGLGSDFPVSQVFVLWFPSSLKSISSKTLSQNFINGSLKTFWSRLSEAWWNRWLKGSIMSEMQLERICYRLSKSSVKPKNGKL